VDDKREDEGQRKYKPPPGKKKEENVKRKGSGKKIGRKKKVAEQKPGRTRRREIFQSLGRHTQLEGKIKKRGKKIDIIQRPNQGGKGGKARTPGAEES